MIPLRSSSRSAGQKSFSDAVSADTAVSRKNPSPGTSILNLSELDGGSLYVVRRHDGLKHIYGEASTAVESAKSYFLHNLEAMAARIGDNNTYLSFLEIDPQVLNRNFQVNTMALLYLARRLAPAMVVTGEGVIIATGNTSAFRGKANFAGFAPTKAAQRILAEAIARELGPKGVHISYVMIDAVIDLEWTRKRWPDAPDDFFITPAAIAEEVWHVAHQDRCAWSFNVELRSFGETW
jgi:NAD(P)-dependent dehydrogenase (short-subunit alcohol dehydrogenase family)